MFHMKQKSVALTARHWEAVKSEAARMGVSIAYVLRRIVDDWLDRPTKDTK